MKHFFVVLIALMPFCVTSQNEELGTSVDTLFVITVTPENIKTGFFETFEDFIGNKVITGINANAQKRSTKERLHLKDADTRKKIKHFAYYNGVTLYINAWVYSSDRYYVKAEWLNEYVVLVDEFENEDVAEDMTFAFGLLGALASNHEQFAFLNLETSVFYTITKRNLIKLIKLNDKALFEANRDKITENKVLMGLLREMNQKMGKEAFYEILFE